MKSGQLRSRVAGTGSFVSVPAAYETAGAAFRDGIKLQVTKRSGSGSAGAEPEMVFFTDRVMVDLGAVAAMALDTERIARACERLRHAAENHPGELIGIVRELQGGTLAGIRRAGELVRVLGLDEADEAGAGGGLPILAVAVVAALAAEGCAECGDVMTPAGEVASPPRRPSTSPSARAAASLPPDSI